MLMPKNIPRSAYLKGAKPAHRQREDKRSYCVFAGRYSNRCPPAQSVFGYTTHTPVKNSAVVHWTHRACLVSGILAGWQDRRKRGKQENGIGGEQTARFDCGTQDTGEHLTTLTRPPEIAQKGAGIEQLEVWELAFSPDGKTLASASSDGAIRLWDIETGQYRTIAEGTFVPSVAFSPGWKNPRQRAGGTTQYSTVGP